MLTNGLIASIEKSNFFKKTSAKHLPLNGFGNPCGQGDCKNEYDYQPFKHRRLLSKIPDEKVKPVFEKLKTTYQNDSNTLVAIDTFEQQYLTLIQK